MPKILNTEEFLRWLRKHDSRITVDKGRGKGSHMTIRLGDRTTTLVQRAGRKVIGKGLVRKMLNDLGIEQMPGARPRKSHPRK